MTDPAVPEPDLSDPKQRNATLFAGLVLQNVNMALMFLGRIPGPEGKPAPRDLNAAAVFVDTLEMLEEKTRGNLDKEEAEFLKQGLMSARMAFAQTVNEPVAGAAAEAPMAEPPPTTTSPAEGAGEDAPTSGEDKVRFSKKY